MCQSKTLSAELSRHLNECQALTQAVCAAVPGRLSDVTLDRIDTLQALSDVALRHVGRANSLAEQLQAAIELC